MWQFLIGIVVLLSTLANILIFTNKKLKASKIMKIVKEYIYSY